MKPKDYLKVFETIAGKKGWQANPDQELLLSFAEGIVKNKEKHGMPLCPCRLSTGKKEIDKLITCPCTYAEDDIKEYGRCYCGLYYSKNSKDRAAEDTVVPDRHFENYL